MAMLEEVLVPMYFFHRYQTEATAKVIGGLNYRYALRGDGQPITEMVGPQAGAAGRREPVARARPGKSRDRARYPHPAVAGASKRSRPRAAATRGRRERFPAAIPRAALGA